MDLLENLLDILHNSTEPVSGEELAKKLYISRNAIWKAINKLREKGYVIDASPRKGYMLSANNQTLSAYGIQKHLKTPCKIMLFKELGSTNTFAKQLCENGESEGTVIIAENQTAGRGRLGRSFYSHNRSGIYLSLILRPNFTAENAVFITTAAAVAVSEALDSVCGCKTGIKWVNDIEINSKKVCGILTEANVNMETGSPDYAVLGIGINLYTPEGGFPQDISDIAGTVFSSACTATVKSRIIAEIIDRFFVFYRALPEKPFMNEYRKRSVLIGKKVRYVNGNNEFFATVNDIDDNACLIVTDDNGVLRKLGAGEVSVRKTK